LIAPPQLPRRLTLLLVPFLARNLAILLLVASPGSIGWADDNVPSFRDDVIPILTRFGCNAGGCHGKLAGQNGFRLSLRGFAPDADFESLVRESRGRRLNVAAPSQSLLLRKATGQVAHGGGVRFSAEDRAAVVLRQWIAAGVPGLVDAEPHLIDLQVFPAEAMLRVGEAVELRVIAVYDDGQHRDVTWLTQFSAADASLLEVSEAGSIRAVRRGESVVRASFQDQIRTATITIPFVTQTSDHWYLPRYNLVDDAVFEKLAALHIPPSPTCDDATFLRRAMLDAIGTLPTIEESRRFLADSREDKRARLVEELLSRSEFIDYWALILGDLLQNRKERDHDVRGAKGVRGLHRWLRAQLAAEKSWAEIAASIWKAEGNVAQVPAVGYYVVTMGEKSAEQSEIGDSVAQAFLGTRIGCARCHNHPLEKYTQDDYYHFIGFFSRLVLDRKKPEEAPTELFVESGHWLNLRRQLGQEQERRQLLEKAANDESALAESRKRIADFERQLSEAHASAVRVRQPRTGQELVPRFLDRTPTTLLPGSDPRDAFVTWATDENNEYFAGAMVNRLWKHFLGVGLVEPVDDLRATNPPSNRRLWDLLRREFVRNGFQFKPVMRLIMNSRTYQLSSETVAENATDSRFYSHFYARRLPAEVLLDAVSRATGVPESFPGYPVGVRAIQIPDPGVESYFLTVFGRPERTTACACERTGDVTLPQLLHLQNNDGLLRKISSPDGALARLLAAENDDAKMIDGCYLATLSRPASEDERSQVLQLVQAASASASPSLRAELYQDLLWALLNSKEFAFQH